jgi:hypothetical protein
VISTKRIGTVVNNSVKNKSFKAKKKLKIDQPLLIINQKQTNRYIEKVDIKGMARKYLLSGELIKNHSAQKK